MQALDLAPPTARRALSTMVAAFDRAGCDGAAFLARIARRAQSAQVQATEGAELRPFFDALVVEYAESMPALSALHAGHSVPLGTYDVVDYLASSAATVGDGFARLSRYLRLARPESAFELESESDDPRVVLHDQRRSGDWFFDEWTLGVTLRGFRATLGPGFGPRSWGLRRPRPAQADAIASAAKLVGATPTFSEPAAYLVFSAQAWSTPLPTHDARLQSTLERHAEALLEERIRTQSFAQSVRDALAPELRGGDPSVESVARRLATTPRTLQRRLRDEGTSFQAELDALRAELAKRYLSDGRLEVSEVAFLLGYSEASAFARAYKRWHGYAPSHARAQR